ncbi:MAG: hypothetical protein AB7N73_16025, partial [Gemmatimonadales bacterium]
EAELAAGIAAIELFVRAGLAESKKQARQFAGTGALRLGDRVVEVGDQVTAAEFGAHEVVFLRRGKRQWAALRRESPENRAAPLEDACP